MNDSVSRENISSVAHQMAAQHGGSIQRIWQDALKGYFAVMTEAQAQALSHNPNVKYVEENAAMFTSSRVPTNVDPACDYPSNCTTADNRLWHLDVLDQNDAVGTHDYAYCTDGSGVYVYVVDFGVMRAHREFNNDPNRVADGYNASGDCLNKDSHGHCLASLDYYPAYDPCHGSPTAADQDMGMEVFGNSHGTGVGSLVAGRNIGVAKNATIVPVKVARCGEFSSKLIQRNTTYPPGVIVRSNQGFYQTLNTGTTGPGVPNPCCSPDGSLNLQFLGNDGLTNFGTVQMIIEGLDWILRPVEQGGNPYPKSPAVVTLSTYRVVGTDGVTNTPLGSSLSFEDAIANLLKYNNGQGITVIASANNQDANACDTSPGRMSRNNPNNPNDPNHPYKVITAGGTMLRNNPDSNPATGGSNVNLPEPTYDSSKATRIARWRCNAGDSDGCSANIYAQPPPTAPNPATNSSAYVGWTLGSNGGQCVTLFAPAKNIPVATIAADAGGNPSYRDSRATNGLASGTSWSAPFVAGVVARILQNNPGYSVDQVYSALMSNTTPDLDPIELDPPGVTGTPNALLHIPDVSIAPLPATITGPFTASASGTAPLTYQW
ncbi:MAG TPA: S8 family serine peptidase, partial [Thermoanaerobaculia bacterium]|nr:S8 family serine peptidase [Thermoanaerobaculia bacterium]